MRLFLAIAIPEPVRQILQAHRPLDGAFIRLIEPSQFHITLRFLGDASASEIAAAMDNIAFSPFELYIKGVGCFSKKNGSKILWTEVMPSAALSKLYSDISKRLSGLGFATDTHNYTPHITLARAKPRYSEEKLKRFLLTDIPAVSFEVDQFTLFNSLQIDGKPVYQSLNTWFARPTQ